MNIASTVARVAVIVTLTFCFFASSSSAQIRQTKLYIDDGSGNFSILQAAPGGGTLTLPGSTLAFPVANASGVLTNNGSGTLSWGAASGFAPSYINAYSTLTLFVPLLSTIPISTVAYSAGITSNGFGAFTVTAPGIYNVEYSITPTSPGTFAIAVNGTVQANSQIGCATGTTVIHNNAIESLNAGDVITLVNAFFVTAVLSPVTPGSVTASLTAIRIQ
jgi:hypothetical protein